MTIEQKYNALEEISQDTQSSKNQLRQALKDSLKMNDQLMEEYSEDVNSLEDAIVSNCHSNFVIKVLVFVNLAITLGIAFSLFVSK